MTHAKCNNLLLHAVAAWGFVARDQMFVLLPIPQTLVATTLMIIRYVNCGWWVQASGSWHRSLLHDVYRSYCRLAASPLDPHDTQRVHPVLGRCIYVAAASWIPVTWYPSVNTLQPAAGEAYELRCSRRPSSRLKTICEDDSGYITQVILPSGTSPHTQCADK